MGGSLSRSRKRLAGTDQPAARWSAAVQHVPTGLSDAKVEQATVAPHSGLFSYHAANACHQPPLCLLVPTILQTFSAKQNFSPDVGPPAIAGVDRSRGLAVRRKVPAWHGTPRAVGAVWRFPSAGGLGGATG